MKNPVMWIVGVLLSFVMALSAIAWQGHESRISRNELTTERLSPIIMLNERAIIGIDNRLRRIESKIDWLVCTRYSTDCGPLP